MLVDRRRPGERAAAWPWQAFAAPAPRPWRSRKQPHREEGHRPWSSAWLQGPRGRRRPGSPRRRRPRARRRCSPWPAAPWRPWDCGRCRRRSAPRCAPRRDARRGRGSPRIPRASTSSARRRSRWRSGCPWRRPAGSRHRPCRPPAPGSPPSAPRGRDRRSRPARRHPCGPCRWPRHRARHGRRWHSPRARRCSAARRRRSARAVSCPWRRSAWRSSAPGR